MQKTIYHTGVDSPWGSMFLAGTEKAVCSCEFIDGKDIPAMLLRLQELNHHAVIEENQQPLASAVNRLSRYFSGDAADLDHPLDLRGSPFKIRVWSALREIPLGRVATYGEIAARIGSPRAARAVGQACGSNQVVLFVPCHRVVATQGKLGGFGGGPSLKKALLLHEGVSVKYGVGNERRGRGDATTRRRGEVRNE